MAGILATARTLPAPFVPASAPLNRRAGRRCNPTSMASINVSNIALDDTANRRAMLGATLAAAAGLLWTAPAQAKGNAVFSPALRSKELAEKEARRKAELKEKYAKLRQDAAQPVSSQ